MVRRFKFREAFLFMLGLRKVYGHAYKITHTFVTCSQWWCIYVWDICHLQPKIVNKFLIDEHRAIMVFTPVLWR